MHRLAAVLVACALASPPLLPEAVAQAPGARAAASKRERERRAQVAYAAGRYDEAIEILAALHAEFGDPVYLRNIGRAYQRLRQPERAIASFEEYLRQAPDLTPAERAEIQGFLREMEELLRARQPPAPPAPAAAPPAPEPAPPPPAPATAAPRPTTAAQDPRPSAPLAEQRPPAPARPDLTSPPPAPERPPMSTGRLAGLLTLGGAGLLAAGGGALLAGSWAEYRRGKKEGCPGGYYACDSIANRVEARSLWAKVLFGGAVVTALVGGTLVVVSPATEAGHAARGLTVSLGGRL